MAPNKRFIDDKEVARITGRGIQTLRNDRFKGQGIPYMKFGRLVRYDEAEVIRFVEGRRIETDPI